MGPGELKPVPELGLTEWLDLQSAEGARLPEGKAEAREKQSSGWEDSEIHKVRMLDLLASSGRGPRLPGGGL